MKRILLSFTLICLSLTAMCQRPGYNPYATQQPTEWSGTGWALNNGYVVTNHHVADNARTILLKFSCADGWKEYAAETVLLDEENDLGGGHPASQLKAESSSLLGLRHDCVTLGKCLPLSGLQAAPLCWKRPTCSFPPPFLGPDCSLHQVSPPFLKRRI